MFNRIFKEKRNPLKVGLRVAVLFFVVYTIIRYVFVRDFSLIDSLVGSIVFFAIYAILQYYYNQKGRK